MGHIDRRVLLVDESSDPINVGNPLPTSGSGGGGGGGTSQTDKSSFGEGSGIGTPIMGVFNDTLAAPVTEDKTAAVRITSYRGLHANLRDDSGNELGTAASPLRTDPTGTTPQPVSGTVTVIDGGGSITVDGTLAATQSGSWTVAATQSGSWSVSLTGSITVANLNTLDYDTGAGTVTQALVGIALPGAGGPVAGGTLTNPVRTDPTGSTAQPVTDGGGSLTVDGAVTVSGTVAATQSGTWAVQLTDGSLTASVRNTGSNDSLNVAITDASGNQITSFGGGTQYMNGDTDATPMGTLAMWFDTSNVVRAVSAAKPLPVTVVSGGGGGMIDDSAFTPGGSTVVPMGALFNDVSPDTVDEGDIGAPRMSGTRILYVTTASGSTVAVSDGGGSLTVDGTVSISGTVTVSGTVAATQSGAWTVTANAGSGTFAVKSEVQVDYDSGAGTQSLSVFGLALPGSGGAVAGGTATNPVRTDPTGSTAQPVTDNGGSLTVDGAVTVSGSVTVSGTVAATQSGSWSVTADAGSGTFTVDQVDTASLDYDSGAGTVNQTVIGIALPGAGGPVAGGTATNPVRTDPTGTTAQPITDNGGSLTVDGAVTVSGSVTVSGTVAATQSGVWTVTQSGTWTVGLSAGSNTIGKVDQGVGGANAWKVDGSAVTQPVSGTFWQATQPVSGTVTANAGSGTFTVAGTKTSNNAAPGATNVGTLGAVATAAAPSLTEGNLVALSTDLSGSLRAAVTGTVAVSSVGGTVSVSGTVAATQSGTWTVQPGNTANTTAWKVDGSAVTQPVSGTFWQATQPVSIAGTVTVAQTNIATADYDTGAGTVTQSMVGIALPASGGPVAGGTATNPVRTDPTGSTTQPVSGTVAVSSVGGTVAVSGTVAATQSGTWTVQPGNTANTTAWKVDGSAVTQPVSGTVSISGSVTVTGTVAATQSGAWNVGLSTGTNSIGDVRSITTSVVPGTGATNLGKAEDTPHVSGDTGVLFLGVRNDVRGSLTDTNGDYTAPQFNASGDMRMDGSAVTQPVAGNLTHNNAVPAATNLGVLPALANTDTPSYNEGDQVLLSVDLDGALRINTGADIENVYGYECQTVYDPVVRAMCEQIFLRLESLEDRMFAED